MDKKDLPNNGTDPDVDKDNAANQPTDREKELEAALAKAEEEKLNLRKGLDEKGKELNSMKEQLTKKADDVISGDASASDLTQQEIDDMKYMSKLGFMSHKKVEEIVKQVKEETTLEVEAKLTKKELRERINGEIESLANQHDFVDKEELKKFMSEKAEKGVLLDVDDAFTLCYKDKIIAGTKKPDDVPAVEKTNKQGVDEPKPKLLELGSREMSERIAERIRRIE